MRPFLQISYRLMMLVFCFSNAKAQVGITGVPFLQLNASPEEFGMAGAFTALQSNSTYAAWYNPAQLGFDPGYSVSLAHAPKSDWLPEFNIDLGFHNTGIRGAYSTRIGGLKTVFGASFSHFFIDLGKQYPTDENGNDLGEFESYDYSNNLSFGAGIEVFRGIQFSAGYTLKHIKSKLTADGMTIGNVRVKNPSLFAHDLGLIGSVQLEELFNVKPVFVAGTPIQFKSGFLVGYTLKNIGGSLNYVEDYAGDPLPRFAHIGIAANMGIEIAVLGKTLSIITATASREAREQMVGLKSVYSDTNAIVSGRERSWEYVNGLTNNFSFRDNLIHGNTRFNIYIHEGIQYSFFETFTIRYGRYLGDGYEIPIKTKGFTISMNGIKKLFLNEYFPVLKPFGFQLSTASITQGYIIDGTSYYGFQINYSF